ncbi:DNA/RNA helicase protein [Quillaja saponaria]|uniref:DNA/RNA helicase protein n=1 Tax=Quillaja saponaria TaxID=32244 RepID=A0AAD7PGJ3_QUISA|nr:DNA/RNA helicase protein [Quillaja saponaria]
MMVKRTITSTGVLISAQIKQEEPEEVGVVQTFNRLLEGSLKEGPDFQVSVKRETGSDCSQPLVSQDGVEKSEPKLFSESKSLCDLGSESQVSVKEETLFQPPKARNWWTTRLYFNFPQVNSRSNSQWIVRFGELRRTKETKDKKGRPILVLRPTDIQQVIECEQSEAEHDFYDAHLTCRCRGNSQKHADLNKLARRFLECDSDSASTKVTFPSRAYIEEVVEGIQGVKTECPICMESADDPAHTINTVLKEFNENTEKRILLMSLKAGGVVEE